MNSLGPSGLGCGSNPDGIDPARVASVGVVLDRAATTEGENMQTYEALIEARSKSAPSVGFDAVVDVPWLFPFQRAVVEWALRGGRRAAFLDTGLGKTRVQLAWADHVCRETGGRVLILAPLAVGPQTAKEAATIGIDGVAFGRHPSDVVDARIAITNYDNLDKWKPVDFAGVVLDESSILKAFTGATRTALIEAFAATPYRLACTATPAPNDFTELGNHSEFLGIKSRVEMLAEYFVHDGGSTSEWRLKGHARDAFWKWLCSWGCAIRKPSDLGYADDGYNLPPLNLYEHVIRIGTEEAQAAGMLFAAEAVSLSDQRATRRATLDDRARTAVSLADDGPVLIWCELNDEADAIEKMIPDAVQVRGADDVDVKADRLLGFSEGRYRVLVTKPSIAGFGMNWQHCNRMVFVGASHSYEQTYQAIRRCWRFGQARPVDVHLIRAETEGAIVQNFRRKEADAERLAVEMGARVSEILRLDLGKTAREWNPYNPTTPMTIPRWLESAK